MKIKNFILPGLLVVALGAFIVYKQFFSTPAAQPPITNNDQNNTPVSTTPTTPVTTTPTPPATQTGYKDGQYTGAVASTEYGDIQVQVTVSGGKITDVQMVQTPTGAGHTAQLVASSFPILKSEAIVAQSSKVNVVSGATQNSQGFMQSLSSALSMAS